MRVGEPALENMDITYIIAALTVITSATMVISTKYPIHAIFWLVITFIGSVIMFFNLGLDYIAFLILVVYIGAIAVLFLFVIMMLHTSAPISTSMYEYAPIGFLITLLITFKILKGKLPVELSLPSLEQDIVSNIYVVSNLLYTNFAVPFIGTSFALLTALIGAIILTHNPPADIKRQIPLKQINRKLE